MKFLLCVLAALIPNVLGATINKRDTSSLPPVEQRISRSTLDNCVETTGVEDICFSPDCIHTASAVLDSLDSEVEPCDDFYQFACGKFIKNTIIPDEMLKVTKFSILDDKLKRQLSHLLSETSENEIRSFKLAKQIYASCMNKTQIDERGLEPVEIIHNSVGGWPVVVGKSWEPVAWNDIFKKISDFGIPISPIISISVGDDYKNSTVKIILIDQPSFGIDLEYFAKGNEDKTVSSYLAFMVNAAVLFGAGEVAAMSEMTDVLFFEASLAKLSVPQEQRRNFTEMYNVMPIEQVQKDFPSIDWLPLINSKFPEGFRVNETERIMVQVPEYFRGLEILLANTTQRTLANYMVWRTTQISIPFLHNTARYYELLFQKESLGNQKLEPRWRECAELANDLLPIPVSALYVRKHFTVGAKRAALDMSVQIQKHFQQILETVEWMDDKTRLVALRKLKVMGAHIGFPDELMDDVKIDEHIKNIETVDESKFFEASFKILKHEMTKVFRELRKPSTNNDWTEFASSAFINAHYYAIKNSILFPAGILQGEFFSPDRPKYMNYGAIGYFIGHEMTHGFDDEGSQFDDEANMKEWWEEKTKTAFLERAQCIIEQYGNFTDRETGMKLNGINTQGENIADNGGVKEAYFAYKNLVKLNGPEPKLPGLNFTQDQMFWIASAQTWCSAYRPDYLKQMILVDVHSPAQFRVNGPLSNMPEFASDFKCPENSLMNPSKKCVVW